MQFFKRRYVFNVFCLYNHFSITKFTLNNLTIANVP